MLPFFFPQQWESTWDGRLDEQKPGACSGGARRSNMRLGQDRFSLSFSFFFFLIYLIYLFLAALGLCCCVRAFSRCGEWGATLRCGARASHCGGFSCCKARALSARASVVVAHGLRCSVACGIFPDQGLNLCPLHWQAILNHCATREFPLFLF